MLRAQGLSDAQVCGVIYELVANMDIQQVPQAVKFCGIARDAQGRYASALAFEYLAGGTWPSCWTTRTPGAQLAPSLQQLALLSPAMRDCSLTGRPNSRPQQQQDLPADV